VRRPLVVSAALLLLTPLLAGCGMFGAQNEAPPVPTRTPVPTFTPTIAAVAQPDVAPASVPPTPEAAPATATVAPTPDTAVADPVATEPAASPTPPVTPAAAEATLTVTDAAVNVRSGPGTGFDLVGLATAGDRFAVTGKSAAGDWWQICCLADQPGWVFGALATVANGDAVPVVAEAIAEVPAAPAAETPAATPAPTPTPVSEPAVAAPAPDPSASSAGYFDPNAAYQIVHLKVLGLDENNGGIRDSSAQHHIFLTVLDQNGNGVDGAVVRNLVGDKSEVVTGNKGPGKAEIAMYYEPFKLAVVSDPSGPVTSQVSNQMGLVFPHLPDLVGRLGDVNYEYGACPTLEIKCEWPLAALHFSYEITFQKVK
jgi:hypothetical protein